jgi:hypothetical protein
MADAHAGPDDGWLLEGRVDHDVVLEVCRLTDGHRGHVRPDDRAVEDRGGGGDRDVTDQHGGSGQPCLRIDGGRDAGVRDHERSGREPACIWWG